MSIHLVKQEGGSRPPRRVCRLPPVGPRRHGQGGHADARGQTGHVHRRDAVAQLEVLHVHAEAAQAAPEALALRLVLGAGARVVEALLRLAPVAALREVRAQQRGVDAPEVALRDVRLDDLGAHEEDLPELADELEAFVQGGDAEGADRVLVGFDVPAASI